MERLHPHALGLGLRTEFYTELFASWPAVDYFEAITENFTGAAWPPRENLERVRSRYPVVLHGVGLNLLGADALNEAYLEELCRLADSVDAPFVSDHLCWTGSHGLSHHDLLPTPYSRDLLDFAAERAAYVQKRLGRPFALENLSSYVTFARSEMTEWEFFSSVVERADIGMILDINNIYVSSQNHGFDAKEYLAAIPFERVLQVHLAGHHSQGDGRLVDTHDGPVAEAVWNLYASAWKLGGPFPTLLEWDSKIPSLPILLAELQKARFYRGDVYEIP